ncbi:2-hydroxyacid dehydrogenase [Eubacterium limosum]|uniref:2-hydroxyacid dehydrogenase n=1 Tax=Eubacterium limosum TaxID=1736 RepID=UPI0022DFC5E5|nr:2-hydroxyacid dehydrogenase [Eubacterium limosum]
MKIVIMEPLGITEDALQTLSMLLRADGHEFIAYENRETDTEKLIERVKDADVVVLANQPFGKEVIDACKNLKLVDIAFTGVDHVDVAACKERGIILCNAAGYSTNAVAELAFGLMIDVYRYIVTCDHETRNGGTIGGLIGNELCGKKLGIVGTGAIGLKVAEIGKAFGCELLAYSRTVRSEGLEMGIKYMDLEELLKQSDIVTLHIPVSPETQGLISRDMLTLMKPEAIIINTSRGGVIDNEALADALKEGKVAGAGIDVYEEDPPLPKDYPLLSAPNTVLTPHVAYATKESLYKRAVIVFDNIRCWLEGNPQNRV